MSDSEQQSAEQTSTPQPAGRETHSPMTNPTLTASLSADIEALRNDMEQANKMAADFQSQLAGKSNEFALLKQVFEKTQGDLIQLQTDIVELRQERHRLANEAMRAVAFEMKLKAMTAERDQSRNEFYALQERCAEDARKISDSEVKLAKLTARIESLSNQLTEARQTPGAAHTPSYSDPELRSVVRILSDNIEQLRNIIDPVIAASSVTGGSNSEAEDPNFIEVVFDQ
jgi:chromosome segregation ATPase